MKKSSLKRIGRRGKINLEANHQIALMFDDCGIDTCEIKLQGCLGNMFNQNVHRHKRQWYYSQPKELLWSFYEVVRGCQNCHNQIEHNLKLTEQVFNRLRG